MKLTDPILGHPDLELGYLAFDSLGVKGACVRVTTPDLTIVVDPGASLEGDNFPLPAAEQSRLLGERLDACRRAAAGAQALVISHYHLDHFIDNRDPELYGGKILLIKDPDDLPPKQAARADTFLRTIDGLPKEVITCDGRSFSFGRTTISFSKPVPHGATGPGTDGGRMPAPGTVVMTTVRSGRESITLSSDVCGPAEEATAELICAGKPRTVVLDGYPTHVLGQYETDLDLVRSVINACRILHVRSVRTLVLDHHHCRDYRYPAFYRLVYERAARLKKRFGTVAELAGGTSAVLRGYQDYGPTRWRKWQPLDLEQARRVIDRAVAERKADPAILKDLDRWVV
ncbi:MAG: MBL fold metallo-hydrolase [bacterium]